MSEILQTDVIVVGGGLAGLAMTARLATSGVSVICIEAGPRPSRDTAERDKRTTAVLMPGIETLRIAGAWDTMSEGAQPMMGLRILDCGGKTPEPRENVLFEAEELGDGPFGWAVENGKGRLALANHVDALQNVTLINQRETNMLDGQTRCCFGDAQEWRQHPRAVDCCGRWSALRYS